MLTIQTCWLTKWTTTAKHWWLMQINNTMCIVRITRVPEVVRTRRISCWTWALVHRHRVLHKPHSCRPTCIRHRIKKTCLTSRTETFCRTMATLSCSQVTIWTFWKPIRRSIQHSLIITRHCQVRFYIIIDMKKKEEVIPCFNKTNILYQIQKGLKVPNDEHAAIYAPDMQKMSTTHMNDFRFSTFLPSQHYTKHDLLWIVGHVGTKLFIRYVFVIASVFIYAWEQYLSSSCILTGNTDLYIVTKMVLFFRDFLLLKFWTKIRTSRFFL
jgi:hypothetical protein